MTGLRANPRRLGAAMLVLGAFLTLLAGSALGQDRLPADRTTRHTLELPDRTLRFAATAGTIRLDNDRKEPLADVAFVAYELEGRDRRARPVTFVFSGGPGGASASLQADFGPWRVAAGGATATAEALEWSPNVWTWLDFTDLVFIDPPGTGYSRIVAKDGEGWRRLWSVGGDARALAEVVGRWLDRNSRSGAPTHLLGASYGGFRAPLVAAWLQYDWFVSVRGLVLLSPSLGADGSWNDGNPFHWVDRLPTQVAATRALKGPVGRPDLAEAEAYAATDYLIDLARGEGDAAAMARIGDRLEALTGLDRAWLDRLHGHIDSDVFLAKLGKTRGLRLTPYDATLGQGDPTNEEMAAGGNAILALYREKLNWQPGPYRDFNDTAFQRWDMGGRAGTPQRWGRGVLRERLTLDPRLRVLIGHGLFDLNTPYFRTVRMMNDLPRGEMAGRVRLVTYPSGHAFHSDGRFQDALREAGTQLFRETMPWSLSGQDALAKAGGNDRKP